MTTPPRRPQVQAYARHAAKVTSRAVLHPEEKEDAIAALPRLRRKRERPVLEAAWVAEEDLAAAEAGELVALCRGAVDDVDAALVPLAALRVPELLGQVETERARLSRARGRLDVARDAVGRRDFGAAGAALDEAQRELVAVGGPLIAALNGTLSKAAIGREMRERLLANATARRTAKQQAATAQRADLDEAMAALVEFARIEAAGYALATEILAAQLPKQREGVVAVGADRATQVVPPHQCETFADVGGLDDVKATLAATIGAILEAPDEAAKYRVVHNGILFYGPPGTGKTLLSRAIAGEYGLRYIRFSPATIASSYIHEAAANLRRLFETAAQNAPCVLFLDEIDVIAGDRGDQPSADHREVVTQLMNSLEEYRTVPGLVIVAATNDIDKLDPGLREGRFDARISLPLPDVDARADIIRKQLERRTEAVDWDAVDVGEVARLTAQRNAAAIESFVSIAAQAALAESRLITQDDLLGSLRGREATDRLSIEERLSWDDVVLDDDTRERVSEILNVFSHPELARSVGVKPPPGVLLYGPPGTGKTTIAKVMANVVEASFYEMSAAELLSKWAGESEQKVAKLFTRARANRPTIIFIDEIDGLLRRRSADAAPWEERVVSQFLRELDGLRGGEGVLLVGATNRLDIIDDAIVSRRLTPIEVGLPDVAGRVQLLTMLCRDVSLAKDVNLKSIATSTEGMSGADLRRIRDVAGMKALNRATRARATNAPVAIRMADLRAALEQQRGRASLAQV